jgi:lysophospholipase L1-like esterase
LDDAVIFRYTTRHDRPPGPAACGGPVRFVALGDSLTQGVGDPRPGRAGFSGELDGWVSYFTAAVWASGQAVEQRNFAVAGARIEHVIDEQLEHAVSGPADIVSCFIGINDLWDANLDFGRFAERFNVLFRSLTATAPIVLTSSIHDVFAPFPIRAPLREKLNGNVARMNSVINDAVGEYGLVLIDLAARTEMFTSAVRAVDRLHPNRYGHQLIAAEVVNELHRRGHLLDVQPPLAQPSRRGTLDLAHVAWVSGYVRRNWKRWRAELAAAKANNPGKVDC